MRSDRASANKQPRQKSEPEPQTAEQRVWFPPMFEDFETAMEVSAYVCRR